MNGIITLREFRNDQRNYLKSSYLAKWGKRLGCQIPDREGDLLIAGACMETHKGRPLHSGRERSAFEFGAALPAVHKTDTHYQARRGASNLQK